MFNTDMCSLRKNFVEENSKPSEPPFDFEYYFIKVFIEYRIQNTLENASLM